MIDVALIKQNMAHKNDYLSPFATKDDEAIRLIDYDASNDIRPPFFKDADAIMFCLSYTRYIDKTQVFIKAQNDNITKRVLHVQLVSKIARTIGRALNLNEDLIEAIALGHDVGHVPFGHTGESILNKISLEHNEGCFMHNIQSVRNLAFLEKYGKGLNLTVQTLDGILCHNGEILSGKYAPIRKDSKQVLKEYYDCYKDEKNSLKLSPMTLEGCVVRISDVIAYIGRDIEDGIRLGLIKESDIPKDITDVLGQHNNNMIDTLVMDIIENSVGHNYIKLSDRVFKSLNDLQKFNYENIYYKAHTKEDLENYEMMFRSLFDFYLNALDNNINSDINDIYLKDMSDDYKNNNTNARIVIDYLAGMTDNFFIKKYRQNIEKKNMLINS